ncbi:hypothetical protein CON65_04515 [Bacillus pseudomycoides]|uniref:Uncharacterized protein n=1 Tax=Bacillus pseudomycoides TaxID=64104 RepID=A0AA91ZUX8_9BACI|nr:hypothetical protein COO03_09050 [Bacillus sp. AFS098217]PED83832.1 hypothetical protein CON65_04515 [Bacillus pseudomycoides]PEU14698.1 hypothetical protein CN524_08380 [Bacillus sp. AFS019443]PEU19549.1 hypothetical protein CN525_07390 [Bacillus sp. AFS014408]PFW64369.1 hypothetical protein COL20_04320 [Bacillus sp. AFS075034]
MIPIIKASRQQFTLIILHFSFFLYEIFQFVKLYRRKTAFQKAVKSLIFYIAVYIKYKRK